MRECVGHRAGLPCCSDVVRHGKERSGGEHRSITVAGGKLPQGQHFDHNVNINGLRKLKVLAAVFMPLGFIGKSPHEIRTMNAIIKGIASLLQVQRNEIQIGCAEELGRMIYLLRQLWLRQKKGAYDAAESPPY